MDMNNAQLFVSFVFGAAGGGAGAYFGSYPRRKGENVATHEDINKPVGQVAAVTKATKENEAKISTEVWDRQKHWEIKKEAVFEVLKAAGALHSTIGSLHATYQATPGGSLHETQSRLDAYNEYGKAHSDFARAGPSIGRSQQETSTSISHSLD
jgi:hypothetical protein